MGEEENFVGSGRGLLSESIKRLGMTNVTLSAHTASASARFDPARKRHVGRELGLVLNGKWPMSCVNPAVLMKSNLRRWQPVSMERGPNS